MFNFSSKTEVNKTLKLTDIYKQMNASKEVKQNASNVASVILKNVISPFTLNTKESVEMKEFYIIEIILKNREIPVLFIQELDKIIKIPTIFILKNDDYEFMCFCNKKALNRNYFDTNWTKAFYDIPLDVDVPSVYKFIISKAMSYPYFEKESINDYFNRYNQLKKLDFQINKTSLAIAHDNQSKKCFEYNKRLKEYKEEKNKLLEEVK